MYKTPHVESFPYRPTPASFAQSLVAAVVSSTATLALAVAQIGIPWDWFTLPKEQWLRDLDATVQEAQQAAWRSLDISWRRANAYVSLAATLVTSTAAVASSIARIGIPWSYQTAAQFLQQFGTLCQEGIRKAQFVEDLSWRRANAYLTLAATAVSSTASLALNLVRIGIAWSYDTAAVWLRQGGTAFLESSQRVAADLSWIRFGQNFAQALTANVVASAASLSQFIGRIGIPWAYDRAALWLSQYGIVYQEAARQATLASDMAWRLASRYLSLAASGVTSTATLAFSIGRLGIAWAYDRTAQWLMEADYTARESVAWALRSADMSWLRPAASFARSLVAAAVASTASMAQVIARIGIPWAYDTAVHWLKQSGIAFLETSAKAADMSWIRPIASYARSLVAVAVSSMATLSQITARIGIPWAYDTAAHWLRSVDSVSRESVAAAMKSADLSWRRANVYIAMAANAVTSATALTFSIFRVGIAWAYDTAAHWLQERGTQFAEGVNRALETRDIAWLKIVTRFVTMAARVVASAATLGTVYTKVPVIVRAVLDKIVQTFTASDKASQPGGRSDTMAQPGGKSDATSTPGGRSDAAAAPGAKSDKGVGGGP
jgi:hypothetical protein